MVGLAAAVAVSCPPKTLNLAIKEPVEPPPIASPAANGQKLAERISSPRLGSSFRNAVPAPDATALENGQRRPRHKSARGAPRSQPEHRGPD